jgi:Kef-type K+ transport system membrane component KefB
MKWDKANKNIVRLVLVSVLIFILLVAPTVFSEVEKYSDEKDFIEIDFEKTAPEVVDETEHVDEITSHDAENEEIEETHTDAEESHDEAEDGEHEAAGGHGMGFATTFLWIAVILFFAKLSSLIEKWGQPAVLGELIIGVVLGNLVLLGITIFEPIKQNSIIIFLAELGVVILLFQIGLESNIKEMSKVGVRAGLVAILGVVIPFLVGTLLGPFFLPGLSSNAYLFLGATLTATSVGITARVFKDLGTLNTAEAKIVLGAAVIDDILGLIILAVVSAMVTLGAVSIGMVSWILAKAILFLVGSIVLGQLLAPRISKAFSKVNTGVSMKFTLIIIFCLVFAYLAQFIGLAPIVGAFAAGLILDPVHFRYFKDPKIVRDVKDKISGYGSGLKTGLTKVMNKHAERHIEDFIEPLSMFLVPIFFVTTGIAVNIETMFNLPVLLVALGITAVAILGKLVAGLVAGDVNKWIVGWGMVPRGEVGLIFATIGKGLGVVSDTVFSVIVIMVILTTLIPPIVLNYLIKKENKKKSK